MSLRPPAWATHDRPGSIDIPAATTTVLVEGVGATRRDLSPWLEARIWIHTDPDLALQRCRDRNTDTDEFIDDWMAQARRFLAAERPWSRADLYVCGNDTPSPERTVLIARPGRALPVTSHGVDPIGTAAPAAIAPDTSTNSRTSTTAIGSHGR